MSSLVKERADRFIGNCADIFAIPVLPFASSASQKKTSRLKSRERHAPPEKFIPNISKMVNQHNLNIEPSVDLQRKIISHLWRKSENGVNIDEYVSYFDQYNRTCRGLYLGALHSESMAIVIQTHENLLEFIDTIWTLVQKNHNFTRPELRAFLEHHDLYKGKSPSKIDNTINVALRVWLTIRIQKGEYAPASNVIDWNDSSGIQDFLSLQFPGPMYQGRSGPEIILESNFTAVNLYRLCGIRVEWVCQLEDHLKFDVDRRVLMVYSLSSCLQDHLNRWDSSLR